MRVLLAGDFHGNSQHAERVFRHAKALDCTAVYQLGDFGYGWSQKTLSGGRPVCAFSHTMSRFVEKYDVELSFLDGNHENFTRLYALPQNHDGTRTAAPGVTHLPRGYRFTKDGCTFLTLGGAVSVDRSTRTPQKSWWPEEPLTADDIERAGSDKVNILLSHDAPFEAPVNDRHLDQEWGEVAVADTLKNRLLLSKAVAATRPDIVAHGHLHKYYTATTTTATGHDYLLYGLNCDNTPLDASTKVLDTEELLREPQAGVQGVQ